MNGIFKKIALNPAMCFISDDYAKKMTVTEDKLQAEMLALLEKNHAVMFSLKSSKATYKRIFFPFADDSGTRIAHIVNGLPFSHGTNIKQEIRELISVLYCHDVFYKTA